MQLIAGLMRFKSQVTLCGHWVSVVYCWGKPERAPRGLDVYCSCMCAYVRMKSAVARMSAVWDLTSG